MIIKSAQAILRFGLLGILIASAPLAVPAQLDKQDKAEKEAARQKELEKNTLRLLDDVASEAESLRSRENRSYVLATAADLLWAQDEKRARTLFWEALGSLNLPMYLEVNLPAAKGTNNEAKAAPQKSAPTKEQMEELNKYYARIETRRALLQKVGRHDAQLALEMLRSTRQGPPPQVPGTTRSDPDASLEQELTLAATANDPKRVLQLARETLAKGLDYQLLSLLMQVYRKDADTGAQLVGEIIAKLKTENLATNNIAPHIAASLLEFSRTKGGMLVASIEDTAQAPVRLKLEDEQKQDLVDLLTNAALNATGGGSVVQATQYVMPEIEQYAPDRVARLKARIAEYNRTLPANERNWNNFNMQFDQATPEEMIKAAGKVADEQRAALFYEAAAKAVARGEADRYRELLKNQIEDEEERKRALDALNNQQMFYDIANGKTEDLEKIAGQISNKEQRAIALSELAVLLEQKEQHDQALKFLEEARALVKVDLVNEERSNALLAVMLGYTLIDPPKAFAMIEPAIDQANDQIAKLFFVDKLIKTGTIKDGELILNQQMSLDYTLMRYAAGLSALGKADFDRTKALADRFQRNELKIAARLLIAKAMLRDAAQAPKADQR